MRAIEEMSPTRDGLAALPRLDMYSPLQQRDPAKMALTCLGELQAGPDIAK
jgi:hypothetical protein